MIFFFYIYHLQSNWKKTLDSKILRFYLSGYNKPSGPHKILYNLRWSNTTHYIVSWLQKESCSFLKRIFGLQQIGSNTSYQLSSTVVEGWWFGLVLQPQDLGTLQSMSPPWTSILESNVRPSVWQLLLGKIGGQTLQWSQWAQQHISNRMSEREKSKVSKWFCQSPDFNMIEMQWWDIKRDFDTCKESDNWKKNNFFLNIIFFSM